MRRIFLVLAVALVMAAMLVATAVPAFAGGQCTRPTGEFTSCAGGGGGKGGGGGEHFFTTNAEDGPRTFLDVSGGSGGPGGGEGGRCVYSGDPLTPECNGTRTR